MALHVALVEITGAREIEAPGDLNTQGTIPVGGTASSANSPTGAVGQFFRMISTVPCRYSVSQTPTATANSRPLPANVIWYVGPLQGGETVSVIQL